METKRMVLSESMGIQGILISQQEFIRLKELEDNIEKIELVYKYLYSKDKMDINIAYIGKDEAFKKMQEEYERKIEDLSKIIKELEAEKATKPIDKIRKIKFLDKIRYKK